MVDILLSTLNARYIHSSFGLRYLKANLGELSERAEIVEFTVEERPLEVVEQLLARQPKIVGLGVYIWNVEEIKAVTKLIRVISPETVVVLGGPEVSYGGHQTWLESHAHVVITGEADLAFAEVCSDVLSGKPVQQARIHAVPPSFDELKLPYDLYTDDDIQTRLIYVEASRGCPYSCEFCLSSLDIGVRKPSTERFLSSMQALLDRGVRQFKFVDRTFNLNIRTSKAILEFFLARYEEGMFLHFEMIPDRLPEALKEIIVKFPRGSLQFEVGVQTLNDNVSARINRRQDVRKLEKNLHFLRAETGVHIHADLIVGLPGETLESFAEGFDALHGMGPQEIQVGILKKLKGTTLDRHDEPFGMRYSPSPPFDVVATDAIDFPAMQRLKRFARFWDLYSNSGNFRDSLPLVWEDRPPFRAFMSFCDFLTQQLGRTHKISLLRQSHMLFDFLVGCEGREPACVARAIIHDYRRLGRRDIPPFLRKALPAEVLRLLKSQPQPTETHRIPARQARHLASLA